MANKRMFDKKVVGSDKFIDLPNSSKALYFMAGMEADDKGFFQPRKLQRMCGFSDDDYKILIAKGFFIIFESGVMIITDWNKNNWLDSRRITETEYIDELNLLELVNQKYELKLKNDYAKQMLSENSIVENSIDKNNIEKKENIKRKKMGKYKRILLTEKEYKNLVEEFGKDFINKQIDLLDEYVETNNNKNKYTNFNLVLRKSIRENWFRKSIEKDVPSWFNKKLDIETIEDDEELNKLLKEMESE